MKLPELMPSRPSWIHEMGQLSTAWPADGEAIEPAGCCAKVCLPLVGCQCVAESPLYPG